MSQAGLRGELPLLILWPWAKSRNIGVSVSSSIILASSHPSRDGLWNVNKMCIIVCGLMSKGVDPGVRLAALKLHVRAY